MSCKNPITAKVNGLNDRTLSFEKIQVIFIDIRHWALHLVFDAQLHW